jgi:hypothetical protein
VRDGTAETQSEASAAVEKFSFAVHPIFCIVRMEQTAGVYTLAPVQKVAWLCLYGVRRT